MASVDSINNIKCKMCSKQSYVMKRCTRCHLVYYCCRECQVLDWPSHKVDCKTTIANQSQEASAGTAATATVATAPGIAGGKSRVTNGVADSLGSKSSVDGFFPVNFEKACADLKKLDAKSVDTTKSWYLFRNKVMYDLPSVTDGTPTYSIIMKANKSKDKVTMQENWTAGDIMKVIAHRTRIPIEKMKVIHRGKVITEENMLSVAKDKAVFQVIGEQCESSDGLDQRDVDVLMKQLTVDRNDAIRALKEKGDVVDAMLHLTNK